MTLEAWATAPASAIAPALREHHPAAGPYVAAELVAIADRWLAGGAKSASVLDVGAGVGRVAAHLGAFDRVGIVEPNPDFRFAAQLQPAVGLAYASTAEAISSTGSAGWDVVFSFLVLQHYPHARRLGLIRELASLGRRLLVFQLPVYDEAREPADWTDVGTTTRVELEALAAALDFEVRRLPEAGPAYDPSWNLDDVPPEHFGLHVWERS